jgi:hypothetical protein
METVVAPAENAAVLLWVVDKPETVRVEAGVEKLLGGVEGMVHRATPSIHRA